MKYSKIFRFSSCPVSAAPTQVANSLASFIILHQTQRVPCFWHCFGKGSLSDMGEKLWGMQALEFRNSGKLPEFFAVEPREPEPQMPNNSHCNGGSTVLIYCARNSSQSWVNRAWFEAWHQSPVNHPSKLYNTGHLILMNANLLIPSRCARQKHSRPHMYLTSFPRA
jgi:hypothetical protein